MCVAITLEALHAADVLREALAHFDKPEIVNTDRSSQFTVDDFVDLTNDSGAKFFMDGQGAWRDNVFVKLVWRSIKCERVYLRAYNGVRQARADFADCIDWYNGTRGHSGQVFCPAGHLLAAFQR